MDEILRILEGVLSYQFGRPAARAILEGELRVEIVRGFPRRVTTPDGEHVLTLRPTDGLASLGPVAAERLIEATEPPEHRVIVDEEGEERAVRGRDVFAAHVVEAWDEIRPGDECVIVNGDDEPLAVGKARLSGWEMPRFEHGVAVRVRKPVQRG